MVNLLVVGDFAYFKKENGYQLQTVNMNLIITHRGLDLMCEYLSKLAWFTPDLNSQFRTAVKHRFGARNDSCKN